MSVRHRFLNPEHHNPSLPPQGSIRRRIIRLFGVLALLIGLQTGIIHWAEGLSWGDALWLTFTTAMTVGYGDLAPATTLGRVSTVALMYILAITLLTVIVSDYIEYRFYRRERMRTGRWRYHMKDHLVIINTPQNGGARYFMRIAAQLRSMPDYRDTPIMILTSQFPNGLPPELQELGVVHYHGHGDDPQALQAVHIGQARHIVVLARDENDALSDSYTFDIVHRLHEHQLAQRCVVECVRDDNRQRFRNLGAASIIRPVRTYPEIMIRALTAPGSEKVLEDLFDHANDHPHRYKVHIDDLTWSDVVCALIRANLGTAMAYIDASGEVFCHPSADQDIDGEGLIVLVKTDNTPTEAQIREALDHYREFILRWHAMQARSQRDTAQS